MPDASDQMPSTLPADRPPSEAPPVRKRPGRWHKIWMPIAIFGLFLVLPELLCRVFHVVDRTDARFRLLIRAGEGDAFRDYNCEDPYIFWRIRPDFEGEVPVYDSTTTETATATLRTNSLGMRGKPAELEKAPGALRVLCLGDSCTFGLGVRDDETFCSRLEGILDSTNALKRAGYQRCEVMNGGVTGYSSLQTLLYYRSRRGRELAPDVVVLYIAFNDANPSDGLSDREILDTVSRPWTGSFIERASLQLDMVRVARKWLFDRQRKRLRDRPTPPRASVEELRDNVVNLANECAARGAILVVVRPPIWRADIERMTPEWVARLRPRVRYLDALDRLAREKELHLVAIDEMSEAPGRTLDDLFIDFCHPTSKGHLLIAQKVADRIVSLVASEPPRAGEHAQP